MTCNMDQQQQQRYYNILHSSIQFSNHLACFRLFFSSHAWSLPHSQPSIALNTLKWELSIFNSLRISNLSVCRRFRIRSNGSGHAENEIPTTRRDIDDLLCMRRRRPPRLVPLGPKQTKKKTHNSIACKLIKHSNWAHTTPPTVVSRAYKCSLIAHLLECSIWLFKRLGLCCIHIYCYAKTS